MDVNNLQKVFNDKEETPAFAGAVLISKTKTLYEQQYGLANRSEEIPITPHTRFGMASGCKIFTAVAICQLVEQGLVEFSTKIKDCLPISYQYIDPDITVSQLLTHSSGVPDYFDEEIMDDYEELWRDKPMYSMNHPKDFLPMFQNQQMKFKSGKQFSYSNSGYILLGLLIEELTGMTFVDYIEKNIFERCNMKQSGYFRMDMLPKNVAIGYIDDDHLSSWRTNVYSLPLKGGPDGGAYTTTHDLDLFWGSLLNNQLLSKSYTDLLLTPHIEVDEGLYYGYGVWISMHNDEVFKYFIFGYDPGVRLSSSVYAKSHIHSHILSNVNINVNMYAREIDKLVKTTI
ncbi:serine hydrolase [Mechercharimyces sp. CAU 1602]|uniref:serine hydrolase domain-containing protein n=1 Tax=Mechercharimyces sp. CAU 1602 TaxID=2973933 RepID=UPI002162E7A9|nr:serine hydrolase [Mechercharimyces sp. CAU 1602]MCS1350412.1 beta-lactamase family protein [Mechercharimyces sp. CAU 1602]